MGATLTEAALVLAVGVALAFGANAARDRGLSLERDYFPSGVGAASVAGTDTGGRPQPGASTDTASSEGPLPVSGANDSNNPNDPGTPEGASAAGVGQGAGGAVTGGEADPLATAPIGADAEPDDDDASMDPAVLERLAEKGLSAISHPDLLALTQDPLFEAGAYLLIDARRAEQFAAGHLPGAVHLDPFFPDDGLQAVLPFLQTYERIVVYCNGGECDDSESAAILLLQFGAPPAKLSVYVGGITAWEAAGLPLERDAP